LQELPVWALARHAETAMIIVANNGAVTIFLISFVLIQVTGINCACPSFRNATMISWTPRTQQNSTPRYFATQTRIQRETLNTKFLIDNCVTDIYVKFIKIPPKDQMAIVTLFPYLPFYHLTRWIL
jgi:hypothetical protein